MKKLVLSTMMLGLLGFTVQAKTLQKKEQKQEACCQKSGKECSKEKKEACAKGEGCCKAEKKEGKSESKEILFIETGNEVWEVEVE